MSECIHYWIINSPNGPTATGVCKLCGEIKEFPSVNDTNLASPNQRRLGQGLRFWRMNTPDKIEGQQ